MLERREIYSHGFCLRVEVNREARGRAREALRERLHYGDGRRWRGRGERRCLRGSGWLTGRRPSRKTVIGRLNREEKLALYNVAVVEREEEMFIDLEGVRRGDHEKLLHDILGLEAEDWSVSYFRRLERYIVLSQPEAERLAVVLGGELHRERGRRSRIVWLHHHFKREVKIRTRATGIAQGKIYRVQPERGATAAYRLEVWLEGDRKGRTHFFEQDEDALDEVLASLVEEHDLHPIIRPDVWEGEGGEKPPFVKRDRDLARMTMSAYRGSRPWTVNRHPCSPLDSAPSVVLRPLGDGNLVRPRVSCRFPSSHPTNASTTPSARPSPDGEREIAIQIANDPVSLLTEVVIDGQQDPTHLLRHLVHQLGGAGAVDVGYVGIPGETWYGVETVMAELPPVTGDEMSLVLLVEPDLIVDLIKDTWSVPGGGVDCEALQAAADGSPAIHRLTSCGLLADLMGALRRLCETTGLKVVLITVDDRPDNGRGPWRGSHRWDDGRVRSAIGDAGRYWAHSRYRMERDRITMLKDERHGRPGTIAWQREAPAPAWDVEELLDSLTAEDAADAAEFQKGVGDEGSEIGLQIAVGDNNPAKIGGLDPPFAPVTSARGGEADEFARDATMSPFGFDSRPRRAAPRPGGGTNRRLEAVEQDPQLVARGG